MPNESDVLERVALLPHADPDCTGRWNWFSILDERGRRLPYSQTDRLPVKAWCYTCGAALFGDFALRCAMREEERRLDLLIATLEGTELLRREKCSTLAGRQDGV